MGVNASGRHRFASAVELREPPARESACGGSRASGRNPAAFTLVELVMVIAIVGIVAAIAAPRYGGSIARYRVEAAAGRIGADLALAGSAARATSARCTVRFRPDRDDYEIDGLAGLDGAAEYRVVLSDAPYEAELLEADFGGVARIIFDGFGRPLATGSVLVAVGRSGRLVSINAAGQVVIENGDARVAELKGG